MRRVAELAPCSDKDLDSLTGYLDEACLAAGDTVAREGRICTEFVIVMEGALLARSCGTSRRLGPGDSYGWHEMWDRTPNQATITVEADARLLVMSHAQFRAIKGLVGAPGTHRHCASGAAEVQIVA